MALSEKDTIIKRHMNPVGIFLRILIYPFIAYGIWQHNVYYIGVGVSIEVINWTVLPPVEKTFAFISKIVVNEIVWWNSELCVKKWVSIILLFVFLMCFTVGFWYHSYILIAVSFTNIIAFNLLMLNISHSATKNE
jgi:hypothetical protein